MVKNQTLSERLSRVREDGNKRSASALARMISGAKGYTSSMDDRSTAQKPIAPKQKQSEESQD